MSKSNYKYKVYNGKVIKELLKNSKIYFFAFLFITGMLFGAVYLKNCNISMFEKITEISDVYINNKAGQGMLNNFTNSVTLNAFFFAINMFLGFSLVGYPLLIWLPLLRGMGLGVFSGYMYSIFKFTGLGYCAILIYPGAIISAFAFILACCDSCDYSKNAFDKSIRGKGQFEKDETKIYIIRQLIYFIISVCSSLIESLFALGFSKLFDF